MQAWESLWVVRLLRAMPALLVRLVAAAAALLLFNRFTLWCVRGRKKKHW